jgi:hypothetical protein
MSLGSYQFLPWLREGLGNTITEKDTLTKGGTIGGRPKLSLQVRVNTQSATKDFMMVSPADVIGFSKDLVIRTEPANWSTTFAPNLLAHIEFYEEDFPWRYSPAAANGDKLRPWLSLVVLKENEFTRSEEVIPLPRIVLTDPLALPDYEDTWLWAHVQKTGPSQLPSDKNMSDRIISRLICSRKLEANTRYYAFVIPTFESGRLAGLGKSEEDIKKVLSQDPAWGLTAPASPQTIFPVYYEWFFRTAEEMDFEYLASLLEAKATDPLVGKKPIDCSKPAFDIPDYQKEFKLYVEGALRAPQSTGAVSISQESAANLADFETRIKQLLDLTTQAKGDPVVTPPFYGQKHIFEKTLSLTEETWIHQLNRDPAYRAVSGLGVKVFNKYQDLYLLKAWEQLESIVEANKIIDAANTTLAVCQLMYKNISRLPYEEMIAFAGPVHTKIKVKDAKGKVSTLYESFRQSCFSGAVYSTAFRRLISRRGAFRQKLERNGTKLDIEKLKAIITTKRRRPFTLEEPGRYSIVVIDRPKGGYIFKDNFDDKSLAIPEAVFAQAYNAFVNIAVNPPDKPGCVDKVEHNLPGVIDPATTITTLLSKTLDIPNWFNDPLKIKAASAYPDFEDPMVEKLKELSLEWLAPNLHLIPNNSVTLLESNRKFIEAFMVGVNVAMNREMKWREYPTDERASCFRQFWDVKGIKDNNSGIDPALVAEKHKDISPIDTWKNWNHQANKQNLDGFGEHNNVNQLPGEEDLVLVIRGDLLKCFPNTTIYAVEAEEVPYIEGGVQLKKMVIKTKDPVIKFPVFKAEAGADLKFIGFELTAAAAKGDLTQAGWFFVVQETPGETRFGLDISGPDPSQSDLTWDDASWDLVTGKKIAVPKVLPDAKITAFENNLVHAESLKAKWGKSSADMAYILYQKPVMIAIHANEMLP